MLKIAIWLACILPCFSGARADGGADGNQLIQRCNFAIQFQSVKDMQTLKAADLMDGAACIGLVRGVMDTMQLWQSQSEQNGNPRNQGHGCIPLSVTPMQATKVVIKFLNENPAKLHLNDTILILVALSQAFPCKAL